jgi:hypothetical protein
VSDGGSEAGSNVADFPFKGPESNFESPVVRRATRQLHNQPATGISHAKTT